MIPLSIALMFVGIGIFIGAWIAWVVRWLREPAPIPHAEFIGYQPLPPVRRDPPPMPECKPARDARDWDVGTVDYRFLGVMGDDSHS